MDLKECPLKIIILSFIAGLIFIAIMRTENPISHWAELMQAKPKQFMIMRFLSNSDTISKIRDLFDRDYDYLELVTWVHDRLEFSEKKPDPQPMDPIKILELGEGRCGEFSILYVSACIAHGYQARLVLILRGSNHEWAEVKINGEWIHVDPTSPPNVYVDNPTMYIERNMTLHLVVAFESNSYDIVTDKYNSDS